MKSSQTSAQAGIQWNSSVLICCRVVCGDQAMLLFGAAFLSFTRVVKVAMQSRWRRLVRGKSLLRGDSLRYLLRDSRSAGKGLFWCLFGDRPRNPTRLLSRTLKSRGGMIWKPDQSNCCCFIPSFSRLWLQWRDHVLCVYQPTDPTLNQLL